MKNIACQDDLLGVKLLNERGQSGFDIADGTEWSLDSRGFLSPEMEVGNDQCLSRRQIESSISEDKLAHRVDRPEQTKTTSKSANPAGF